jgi:hypothetical protein
MSPSTSSRRSGCSRGHRSSDGPAYPAECPLAQDPYKSLPASCRTSQPTNPHRTRRSADRRTSSLTSFCKSPDHFERNEIRFRNIESKLKSLNQLNGGTYLPPSESPIFWRDTPNDLSPKEAAPPFVGHSVSGASLFRVTKAGRRDARAICLAQISTESSAEIKLFGSADSSAFGFGEMLAIKKFTLFNVVAPALREVSERYFDRTITDSSTRQGSFPYI